MTMPTPNSSQSLGLVSRILRMLIVGIGIGVGASLLTIGFVEAVIWLFEHAFGHLFGRASMFGQWKLEWLSILVPAAGGLLVGWLVWHVKDRTPATLADLIENVQGRREPIELKNGLLNTLASIAGMGSGASVGQYGPLANLGAMLGSKISQITRVDAGLGIGCGVAAAIATAFSAPIAGLVFVHEVVLRHYSLRAFAPITVASTTGYFINTYVFEQPPLFKIEASRSLFLPEFLGFILVGVVGALLAVVFMKLILLVSQRASKIQLHPIIKPALAGLAVGVVAQGIPGILGIGNETLSQVLGGGGMDHSMLALTLVAKMLATALCVGFGFAGGIFSPAMLVGVLFGALAGSGAEILFGEAASSIEFYAVCGLAAVTSPVIGAPLTTILIVLELTRNYELTTAVMVSVVFSNVVAYRLFGRSLFDRQLYESGFDLSMGRDKVLLDQAPIAGLISTDHVQAYPDATLDEVRQAMVITGYSEAYVVGRDDRFLGTITLNQIVSYERRLDLTETSVGNHMEEISIYLTDDMSVWQALEKIDDFVGECIPVLNSDGIIVGVIVESALVKAYLATVHQLRADENAAT